MNKVSSVDQKMALIQYLLIATVIALNIFGNESAYAPITPYFEDLRNISLHLPLVEPELPAKRANPSDVKFYLFTKNEPQEYYEIDPLHPSEKLKGTEKIVFLIHGWLENRLVPWYKDLKDAYLSSRQDNYKVIQVDWHKLALEEYSNSAYHTRGVGKIVAQLIANMYHYLDIPVGQIVIVGHSLGGQTAGFAGKAVYRLTGKILPRIIALDPAGPLFTNRPLSHRLNPSDAEVVHVIHTNGGTFGVEEECGTIDFFPNGGSQQPGCSTMRTISLDTVPDLVVCNHQRSWAYFIEAIAYPDSFKAKRCEHYLEYQANVCEKVEVAMGDMKTTLEGKFYLNTNSKPLYSKTRSTSFDSEHDSYKMLATKANRSNFL